MAEALRILHDVYADTVEQVLAIPVLRGKKSASERFPGAVETFAIEALMRDGKALQAGTSHYLGQSFARAYNVRFTDRSSNEQFAYATSWGASTRLVGGLIMAHGDDRGLRLPPAVAPYQVVIVPIAAGAGEWARVREASEGVATRLRAAGLRVRVDDREEHRPGFKFSEWELKGVPIRLELGERELDAGQVTLVRRDTGAKERTSAEPLASRAEEVLAEIQRGLLDEAQAFRDEHTLENPKSYEEMREFLEAAGGLAIAPWCGSTRCEDRVKTEARATIRCLPLQAAGSEARCIVCQSSAIDRATWAQSY
jgi:prolyl-tRNA synthetase